MSWASLTPSERAAAQALGYNMDTWDGAIAPPACLKTWDQLSQSECAAARQLGYDRSEWDDELAAALPNAAAPELAAQSVVADLEDDCELDDFRTASWTTRAGDVAEDQIKGVQPDDRRSRSPVSTRRRLGKRALAALPNVLRFVRLRARPVTMGVARDPTARSAPTPSANSEATNSERSC